MPEPKNTVRVRLDIPERDHEKLRVIAAKAKMSMARYCRALVEEALRGNVSIKPVAEVAK